jgi:hypothetical protein
MYFLRSKFMDLVDLLDRWWPWVSRKEYEVLIDLHFINLKRIYDQELEIVRLKKLVGEDTKKEYPYLL